MVLNSVIFADKATPATLTEFQDRLLNNYLLQQGDPWSLDFKTYRSQVTNIDAVDPSISKLLYSITFSRRDTVLIKNGTAVLSRHGDGDGDRDGADGDTEAWFPGPVDSLLDGKLSNIWTQRQSIKGDLGQTFHSRTVGTGGPQSGDRLTVRCCNLFSQTGFKGLAIELSGAVLARHTDDIVALLAEVQVTHPKIAQDCLQTPAGVDKTRRANHVLCNLAFQYVSALE